MIWLTDTDCTPPLYHSHHHYKIFIGFYWYLQKLRNFREFYFPVKAKKRISKLGALFNKTTASRSFLNWPDDSMSAFAECHCDNLGKEVCLWQTPNYFDNYRWKLIACLEILEWPGHVLSVGASTVQQLHLVILLSGVLQWATWVEGIINRTIRK